MQPKKLTGPTIFHLELSEGMDHEFKFVYVNDSTLLPIDLSGYRADIYFSLTTGHPQVMKAISSVQNSPDGSITLGSDGSIQVDLYSPMTQNLPWADAVYDLVLTSPDQRRTKLIRGKVNVYNTVTFPLNFNSALPEEAMILTVGHTVLPNEVELWGYMNPIAMGLGTGLYLTGSLRPTIVNDLEIVELSYSGGHLRVAFLGNVPDGLFNTLRIGSVSVSIATSDGRVFNEGASNGLGMTYWDWTGVLSPFGFTEGSTLIVSLENIVA